jgi:uncharacterized protein HemY
VLIRALTLQGRLELQRGRAEVAGDLLKEAIPYARKSSMRLLLAEALDVHSQQQAAAHQFDEAKVLWDEARRLFTLLHVPRLQPDWLTSAPAESQS